MRSCAHLININNFSWVMEDLIFELQVPNPGALDLGYAYLDHSFVITPSPSSQLLLVYHIDWSPFTRHWGLFILRFLKNQLISNNILANQQPVLGFAMPFTNLNILCKKRLGQNHFAQQKLARFDIFFIQFPHTEYQIQIVCTRLPWSLDQ